MVEYFPSFDHLSLEDLEGEVHVFQLDLADCPPESFQWTWSLLDEEERERAGRLRQEPARHRFVMVRSALRSLLGHYLRRAPSTIRFTLGSKGKPRLAETEPDQGMVFNVSHSGDFGLIALSRDTALGVDVERVRALANLDGMAERCFAPGELVCWRGLPEASRLQAFFEFWSCKEAFLKATGEGISLGLNRVEIRMPPQLNFSRGGLQPGENPALGLKPIPSGAEGLTSAGREAPGEPCLEENYAQPRLVSIPQTCGKPGEWRLVEVSKGNGYSARLCYHGSERKLRMADGVVLMNVLLNMTDLV